MKDLLSNKNLNSLIFSKSFFQFSTHIRILLFTWLAYELTQKDLWVGIVVGVGTSPIFFSTFLGSYLSEKYNINKILFISYISCFIILLLFLFVDYNDIYILMFLSVVFGIIPGITNTAFSTILVNSNKKEKLSKINSYYYLIIFFGEMINPIIVGYLLALLSISYVIVFACVFLVLSLFLVAFHPEDLQEKRKKDSNLYLSYLSILKNKPVIFWAVIISTVQSIFGSTLFVVLPKYANLLEIGASGFGIMNGALGAGLFIGSFVSIFTGVYKSRLSIWILSSIGWDIGQIMFAFSESFVFSLFCLFLMGLSAAYWMVSATLIFQEQSEKFDRNKIMGLFTLVSSIFFIGWLVGGIISDLTNAKTAIIISAISSYPIFIIAIGRSKQLRII
jgi:MFS family permease